MDTMASHKSNCLVGKRLLFLCLARDCAQTIGFFFRYMESLEDLGLYCSAIIGENGSSDGTPNLILQQNNRNVRLLDTSFMGNIGNRLKRLALGRQALLEAASGSGWDEDYVCIVDLDNVMRRPPSLAALQSAMMNLQSDSKIFAIGATSFPVYYDLLSLRAEGYEFLATLDAEIAEAKKHPFKYFQFHREKIYKIQWRMTRPERILCDSSFNGFCIYNSVDFYKGTYRAANETEVC
jgi:hypothetical protein